MKKLTYTMFALAAVASLSAGSVIAGGNGNATQASTSGQYQALINCLNVVNSGNYSVYGTANSGTNSNDPKGVGGHVTNCDKYWQLTGEIGSGN